MAQQVVIENKYSGTVFYIVKDWEKVMNDNNAEAVRVTASSGIEILDKTTKVWNKLHQEERPVMVPAPDNYIPVPF